MAKIERGVEDGFGGILHGLFGVGAPYSKVTLEDGTVGRGKDDAEAIADAAAKKADKKSKKK